MREFLAKWKTGTVLGCGPGFVIQDQHCAGGIVSTGKFVGHRHVAAAFIDEALAIGVDENSFVDE